MFKKVGSNEVILTMENPNAEGKHEINIRSNFYKEIVHVFY